MIQNASKDIKCVTMLISVGVKLQKNVHISSLNQHLGVNIGIEIEMNYIRHIYRGVRLFLHQISLSLPLFLSSPFIS